MYKMERRWTELENEIVELKRRVDLLEKQRSPTTTTNALRGSSVIIVPEGFISNIGDAINSKIGSNLQEITMDEIDDNIQLAFVVIRGSLRIASAVQTIDAVTKTLSKLQNFPRIRVVLIVLHLNRETQTQSAFGGYEIINLYTKPTFGGRSVTDLDPSLDDFNNNGLKRLSVLLNLRFIACEYCNAKVDNLLCCGSCKKVAYCDEDCQAKNWVQHSIKCAGNK